LIETADYCRQIETYLCQKNDGHLIRVVGPSFELVSRWAARGVPLKVAFRGIDRYFERYYRKGPRRRPVRIDFCEADVLDVFDEWQRAVGLAHVGRQVEATAGEQPDAAQPKQSSLPTHLERALARLSNARAKGMLGPEADGAIDRVAEELDRARASAGGLRGPARRALIDRLVSLDAELMQIARSGLSDADRSSLEQEADEGLAPFRTMMPVDAFRRAREAAVDHLARQRLGLPTLSFE
jgi:hypothetical protein